jgi:hypothetical protein
MNPSSIFPGENSRQDHSKSASSNISAAANFKAIGSPLAVKLATGKLPALEIRPRTISGQIFLPCRLQTRPRSFPATRDSDRGWACAIRHHFLNGTDQQ